MERTESEQLVCEALDRYMDLLTRYVVVKDTDKEVMNEAFQRYQMLVTVLHIEIENG